MRTFTLREEERIALELRRLYGVYGYRQFKMSKFEEYDLYAQNIDFLVSDRLITFTDTTGRLMALKPDVTLSIVRSIQDDGNGPYRFFYDEKVYRTSGQTHEFREIAQAGIECIGEIDDYLILEVLTLAAESLKMVSSDCVLEVSHLGIVSEFVEKLGLPAAYERDINRCIGEKNIHELMSICHNGGAKEEAANALKQLMSLHGSPKEVIEALRGIGCSDDKIAQLEALTVRAAGSSLREILRIDFSVINDMTYYNGIVFKGYVSGIPTRILSGGQYDRLMRKMHKSSRAIGFAVYLDLLERFVPKEQDDAIDTLLIYQPGDPLEKIRTIADSLRAQGHSVAVQKQEPQHFACKNVVSLSECEVSPSETDS